MRKVRLVEHVVRRWRQQLSQLLLQLQPATAVAIDRPHIDDAEVPRGALCRLHDGRQLGRRTRAATGGRISARCGDRVARWGSCIRGTRGGKQSAAAAFLCLAVEFGPLADEFAPVDPVLLRLQILRRLLERPVRLFRAVCDGDEDAVVILRAQQLLQSFGLFCPDAVWRIFRGTPRRAILLEGRYVRLEHTEHVRDASVQRLQRQNRCSIHSACPFGDLRSYRRHYGVRLL
eukprot:7391849-Prymnesium_polylepis.2